MLFEEHKPIPPNRWHVMGPHTQIGFGWENMQASVSHVLGEGWPVPAAS